MKPKCDFCGRTAEVSTCGSDEHARLMGCGDKSVCADCSSAHKALFLIMRGLIQSKRAERSDSVRVMLYSALHNGLVECKAELGKIDATLYRHLMATLETTSAFSEDERNFQAAIAAVAHGLPPLRELVLSVARHGEARNLERILTQATQIAEERSSNDAWLEQTASILVRAARPRLTMRNRLENDLRAARRRRLRSAR